MSEYIHPTLRPHLPGSPREPSWNWHNWEYRYILHRCFSIVLLYNWHSDTLPLHIVWYPYPASAWQHLRYPPHRSPSVQILPAHTSVQNPVTNAPRQINPQIYLYGLKPCNGLSFRLSRRPHQTIHRTSASFHLLCKTCRSRTKAFPDLCKTR